MDCSTCTQYGLTEYTFVINPDAPIAEWLYVAEHARATLCPRSGVFRHQNIRYFGRIDGEDGTPGELEHWHCDDCDLPFNVRPTYEPAIGLSVPDNEPERDPDGDGTFHPPLMIAVELPVQGLYDGMTIEEVEAMDRAAATDDGS